LNGFDACPFCGAPTDGDGGCTVCPFVPEDERFPEQPLEDDYQDDPFRDQSWDAPMPRHATLEAMSRLHKNPQPKIRHIRPGRRSWR
jgi:hypothetical protein